MQNIHPRGSNHSPQLLNGLYWCLNNTTVYIQNYWVQSRSVISTRAVRRHRTESQLWRYPEIQRPLVAGQTTDPVHSCWDKNGSWLCCWFVVQPSSNCQRLIQTHALTVRELHNWMSCVVCSCTWNISACRVLVLHGFCDPPLSGCHGDPLSVSLVSLRTLSHWEFFGEVHCPWGSLPVRFPACLALHGPPDGKCLLLITHRWTVCTLCFYLPVTLFISVTVFIANLKVVAHCSVFNFKTSA